MGEPPFLTTEQLRDGLWRIFEVAGLLAVAPWALAITAFLVSGTGCAAYATWEQVATGGHAAHLAPLLLLAPLLGIGLALAYVVALSGTVQRPWRRVLGGVGSGLGAAFALSVATCAGLGGGVYGAPPGASLAVGAVSAIAAGTGAAAWARLRYDASPVGTVVAAAWTLGLALLSVVTYVVLPWLG